MLGVVSEAHEQLGLLVIGHGSRRAEANATLKERAKDPGALALLAKLDAAPANAR